MHSKQLLAAGCGHAKGKGLSFPSVLSWVNPAPSSPHTALAPYPAQEDTQTRENRMATRTSDGEQKNPLQPNMVSAIKIPSNPMKFLQAQLGQSIISHPHSSFPVQYLAGVGSPAVLEAVCQGWLCP